MARIKRGYIARRRSLFASSFRGAHSRLNRTITQQKIRVFVSAHRDRDKQKRNFIVCGSHTRSSRSVIWLMFFM
ncbi:50S ribosomal protein l20 plastid [Phtheirospermum japonicum]|uniref:Large ribosomal subunit protein bL20c n=1 Tax=Phtheirospermum japonicum TaxID=374723 RepID=A0A830C1U9_9LAMI|nr:50S ribosomal protein l20 plastid [Phtheirospermum japonicum]